MAAAVPGGPPGPKAGTVTAFDEDRGLGTVTGDDGTSYGFHCTALTDGSRTVAVGARMTFVVGPGHLGRLEARRLGAAG